MQIRAAFSEGACGAIAFAWTDEWWRGGEHVADWDFGLVDRARRPKPAAQEVAKVFSEVPLTREEQRSWPKMSVVVCAYADDPVRFAHAIVSLLGARHARHRLATRARLVANQYEWSAIGEAFRRLLEQVASAT